MAATGGNKLHLLPASLPVKPPWIALFKRSLERQHPQRNKYKLYCTCCPKHGREPLAGCGEHQQRWGGHRPPGPGTTSTSAGKWPRAGWHSERNMRIRKVCTQSKANNLPTENHLVREMLGQVHHSSPTPMPTITQPDRAQCQPLWGHTGGSPGEWHYVQGLLPL